MSRAWMPLYVSDFLADTQHLDCAEIGAYILLIMHYWQHGGLPDDDEKRRLICRLPQRKNDILNRSIKPFFQDGWKHKRIEQELEKSRSLSSKRSASASQRWGPTNAIASANGYAKGMHRARASTITYKKDSLIGEERGNGAMAKSRANTWVERGTEQWNSWVEAYRKSASQMPEPIPHWETKRMGWYFPTEWPPSMPPQTPQEP